MKKIWLLIIPLLLILLYLSGPAPDTPHYTDVLPEMPSEPAALEKYISDHEKMHRLKPDNEARIIWYNDSAKDKTDYAIVYLHGFSASQFEGSPLHTNLAKKFGCNLYLSRLAEHGIDTTDALINLTAEKYWTSAKEALAIGKQIGKKMILIGTSTGGSNALHLAANIPNDIVGLILLSPNIAINDPNAWALNNHWGIQIANFVKGSSYNVANDSSGTYKQYWNYQYRLEAAVALEEYLETAMTTETFEHVKQPVLLLYYYKNESHQDPVVKVNAMKEMFDELGTDPNLKKSLAMPNTGDHVIGSTYKSKDAPGVQKEVKDFIHNILHLPFAESYRAAELPEH